MSRFITIIVSIFTVYGVMSLYIMSEINNHAGTIKALNRYKLETQALKRIKRTHKLLRKRNRDVHKERKRSRNKKNSN